MPYFKIEIQRDIIETGYLVIEADSQEEATEKYYNNDFEAAVVVDGVPVAEETDTTDCVDSSIVSVDECDIRGVILPRAEENIPRTININPYSQDTAINMDTQIKEL